MTTDRPENLDDTVRVEESAAAESTVLRPLTGASPEEIIEAARRARVSAGGPAVLVVDAAAIGPRVPTRHRVVEVVRRGGAVVAELLDEAGIRRLVRVGEAELLDAGATVTTADPQLAFPPEDPQQAAADLWTVLGDEGIVAVLLASRATPTGVPVMLAQHGIAAPATAAVLSLTDAPAVLITGPAAAASAPAAQASGIPATANGDDWTGRYESARAALGVQPGTAEAIEVGLPTGGELRTPSRSAWRAPAGWRCARSPRCRSGIR
ncbi:hypothetical protein [Mobilicoccus caccae]|uniref:Uncharacterized protein n=1 Tax=Mobilicoccus caccae TaxID=1859295 RepID=A0ABQ6IMK7_9MICO|nr:hypothetical protein [Mobilicoccus caccae]GMA38966.1 hypothetical protein GCM10025883_10110 [Mobilicoccus caccae]